MEEPCVILSANILSKTNFNPLILRTNGVRKCLIYWIMIEDVLIEFFAGELMEEIWNAKSRRSALLQKPSIPESGSISNINNQKSPAQTMLGDDSHNAH
jgi:hypothetical protein